ncbi:hypothetical protein L1O59_004428 [Salmonella enterica]|nr:hypothetical protein [Salmonella enterica]EGP7686050.1 hypothetical protein [Salmonella enterica]EHP5886572.1 hypothetical protein [Salmonella enterica]EIH1698831.1 hypothetical protein [Salmonella enterica]EIS9096871.1 hypothetical protein [Salmonella enterica]
MIEKMYEGTIYEMNIVRFGEWFIVGFYSEFLAREYLSFLVNRAVMECK